MHPKPFEKGDSDSFNRSTSKYTRMIRNSSSINIVLIAVVCALLAVASAFVVPTATKSHHYIARTQSVATATPTYQSLHQRRGFDFRYSYNCANGRLHDTRLYNKFLEFLTPYESKIPEELKEEIFQAEANTEAARDRGTRVAFYISLAILGIALASFNGFLTEMRDKESAEALATAATSIPDTGNNLYILEQNGFGWVLSNPISKFLFTNKIGGIICLLLGGGSGLMAEAEFDTKRLNAEKIYEELERRREQKLKKQTRGTRTGKGKKKRRSGKEKKRLAAISEVIMDDVPDETAEIATKESPSVGIPVMPSEDTSTSDDSPTIDKAQSDENKGVFGKMKELYERADSMAASQALIMNKNLEEAGLVEKITDETGLKVIGREEAKKLEENQSIDEKK